MISETKLHINTLCDKKYPAQMLEETGDLHQALANFENPVNTR